MCEDSGCRAEASTAGAKEASERRLVGLVGRKGQSLSCRQGRASGKSEPRPAPIPLVFEKVPRLGRESMWKFGYKTPWS